VRDGTGLPHVSGTTLATQVEPPRFAMFAPGVRESPPIVAYLGKMFVMTDRRRTCIDMTLHSKKNIFTSKNVPKSGHAKLGTPCDLVYGISKKAKKRTQKRSRFLNLKRARILTKKSIKHPIRQPNLKTFYFAVSED
jgi:hypothetical protein